MINICFNQINLKVSSSQNELVKSSVFQSATSNIWRISDLQGLKLDLDFGWVHNICMCHVYSEWLINAIFLKPQKNFQGRHPSNIWGRSLEINDFMNSFRLYVTFRILIEIWKSFLQVVIFPQNNIQDNRRLTFCKGIPIPQIWNWANSP